MSDSGTSDVTILGAGIGGLMLAAALDQLGVTYQIYEQAQAFSRIGAGIQMTPNAVRTLRGVGLEQRLREIAFDAQYRVSREWQTAREILRIPMGEAIEKTYGAPHLLLHRADLHEALVSRVNRHRIATGMRVVSVRAATDGQGGAEVSFQGGQVIRPEVVVAADGVHSVTRDSLFRATAATYTGTIAYRSVFDSARLKRPLMDPKSKWRGPDRQISIYYVGDGSEVYFTTRVPYPEPVAESFSLEANMPELRLAFSEFHQEVRDFLAACPKAQKWAIYEREPLESWVKGHVALLGDAAHPMPPSMAQGAAMSMEDAVILARCLAEHLGSVDVAFDRYFRTRFDRASTVQIESSRDQWNWTTAGSAVSKVDLDYVYGYDAWTAPLAPLASTVRDG